MASRSSIVAPLVTILALVLLGSSPAEAKKKKKDGPAGGALRVERFLVLGPVAHPWPVFSGETEDGHDLAALLAASILPDGRVEPQPGETVRWFTGQELQWTEQTVEKDGEVSLTRSPEGPAVAWLAVYVSTDRFRKVDVALLGAHPRRLWLDGEPVVSGGTSADDDSVEGEVVLLPGDHCLLVQTVLDPLREADWTVGLEARLGDSDASGLHATTDGQREVQLRDIVDPPTVSALAVAPDGKTVVLAVQRIIPGSDDSESWIEIRNTDDGALIESWRGAKAARQVAFSPDGAYVSYVAATPGEKPRSTLFLYDRQERTVAPLLEGVEQLTGYRWCQDGESIAYGVKVEAEKDERGVKLLESVMDRWAGFRDKTYLHLVAVPDGARRQLTAGGPSSAVQDFSPDGSRLIFSRTLEDLSARPYSRTELWEANLQELRARKLRDFGWVGAVRYSPDGERLLVQGGVSTFRPVGEQAGDGPIPNDYDGQLFLWDPESDEVVGITSDFDPSVSEAVFSPADGKVYFTAEDRDHERLYRYDPQSEQIEALDVGRPAVKDFSLARQAPLAVVLASGPWTPHSLIVADLTEDSARTIEHPADDWFSRVGSGSLKEWDFTASSGKTIDGRIYFPPDFDPERKYPCIVYYYGGTSPVGKAFGGRYPKEWWAANGYVVYVLQPSGATGFGPEFAAAHVNDWGKTTAGEVIEGTRMFLRAHSFVDPKRVGCIGASYGGFLTMLLSTQTDLFAAAVSHAGISSISSYWGEGYWGYSYNSVSAAESFPWNRKDIYVDQSPLFRADQNRVPILLTHGTADTNVPRGESEAFYIALKLLGKDVEYLQIEGEDHWILTHDKRIVWSRSIVAWFDRWLKGRPEWWNELHPGRDNASDETD